MDFAERLYALRREKGLSQEELAEVVGVTRQAVQKWESGASRPDMDNLTALARYFGVTLDYLITGEEPPAPAAGSPTVIEKHYYRECGDFFRPRGDYEYVSRRTLWGLPLVHVHISGRGLARARGIIAVGNVATGLVSLGVFSAGLLSLGVISLGVLLSIGCVSAGTLSLGCFAFGWLALGGRDLRPLRHRRRRRGLPDRPGRRGQWPVGHRWRGEGDHPVPPHGGGPRGPGHQRRHPSGGGRGSGWPAPLAAVALHRLVLRERSLLKGRKGRGEMSAALFPYLGTISGAFPRRTLLTRGKSVL